MNYLSALLLPPLILAMTTTSRSDDHDRTPFDFSKPNAAQAWTQPVNDGVMGGLSGGRFKITYEGTMEFSGTLSLENNGGFASVRSRRSDHGLKLDDTLLMRLRGDGAGIPAEPLRALTPDRLLLSCRHPDEKWASGPRSASH